MIQFVLTSSSLVDKSHTSNYLKSLLKLKNTKDKKPSSSIICYYFDLRRADKNQFSSLTLNQLKKILNLQDYSNLPDPKDFLVWVQFEIMHIPYEIDDSKGNSSTLSTLKKKSLSQLEEETFSSPSQIPNHQQFWGKNHISPQQSQKNRPKSSEVNIYKIKSISQPIAKGRHHVHLFEQSKPLGVKNKIFISSGVGSFEPGSQESNLRGRSQKPLKTRPDSTKMAKESSRNSFFKKMAPIRPGSSVPHRPASRSPKILLSKTREPSKTPFFQKLG